MIIIFIILLLTSIFGLIIFVTVLHFIFGSVAKDIFNLGRTGITPCEVHITDNEVTVTPLDNNLK